MSNSIKRVLSIVLCVVMLFGILATGGNKTTDLFNAFTFKAAAQNYRVGDTISFGSYPQSDVTTSLGSVLNSQTGTWKSYGYYDGTGHNFDGSQVASNYMRYKDVTYNGENYRGVTFDKYRPNATYETATTSSTYKYQFDNGYKCGKVYWFKFEPLTWRILDPDSGLVMCNQIIDSQAFNNYDILGNFSSNYADSSIRKWLINDFYNTAFTPKQKGIILTTELNNDCAAALSGNSGFESCNAPPTNDKIFLLGYDQVINVAFGFDPVAENYDTARSLRGSAYAKCQGLQVFDNGKSRWWERSSTSCWNYVCGVDEDGEAGWCDEHVVNTWVGICPAMRLTSICADPGYNLCDDTYGFANFGYDSKTHQTSCPEPKCKEQGHCFGMALTSSAFYLDILSKGANENTTLYDFPQSSAIMSTICFYQKRQSPIMSELCTVAGRTYWMFCTLYKNINKDWNETISYVRQHSFDYKGSLLFDAHFPGEGCHSTNFIRYENVEGQDRVYVYDNNYPQNEIYFYRGNNSKVYEHIQNINDPSSITTYEVDSIGLFDVNTYFFYKDKINTRDMIFAPINSIRVEEIQPYPICQGIGNKEYVVFEVPSDKTTVEITPLVDNAEFEYLDETYSFKRINENTTATFTLSSSEETNNATLTINNNTQKPSVSIRNYKNDVTVKCATEVRLYADVTDAPEGTTLEWYGWYKDAQGEMQLTTIKCDANQYAGLIITTDYEVYVKLIAKDGSVLAKSQTEKIHMKSPLIFPNLINLIRLLFARIGIRTKYVQ